ncbi:MAG TPA: cytochrome C oxidase subunit I, partial [Caldimonas sp.]
LGGLLLVVSALLFMAILAGARKAGASPRPFTFSVAVHSLAKTPAALNGFSIWVALMIGLTVVNYGFPIAQLALLKGSAVPAIPIGAP